MSAFSGTAVAVPRRFTFGRLLAGLTARSSDPRARARARRVNLLILAVAMMGVADLLCTLTYMRISGMMEANPIARHMIALNGVSQLVMFKLLSILLCSTALYYGRFFRRTEICAWGCIAVMGALTAHWLQYNRSVSALTNEIAVIALHHGGPETDVGARWISLAD